MDDEEEVEEDEGPREATPHILKLRADGKEQLRQSLRDFKESGFTHVEVSTANDDIVCANCRALEGKRLTLQDAEKTIDDSHCINEQGEDLCRCMFIVCE